MFNEPKPRAQLLMLAPMTQAVQNGGCWRFLEGVPTARMHEYLVTMETESEGRGQEKN